MEALLIFNRMVEEFNYFFHQKDSYKLSSRIYICSIPEEKISKEYLCLIPELNNSLNELRNLQKSEKCWDNHRLSKFI